VTEPIGKLAVDLILLIAALCPDLLAGTNRSERPASVHCHPERRTQHDDPAIQQALTVLGQAVNPVRVLGEAQIREIYTRTLGTDPLPAGLNAFRVPRGANDPNIYVNKESMVYTRAASKASAVALLKLAATLAHEQVHNTDGEFAAYRLQSDLVRSRLKSVPRLQQDEVRKYLQNLDARANAYAVAERRSKIRRERDVPKDSRSKLVVRSIKGAMRIQASRPGAGWGAATAAPPEG
jgi:hypothetical protein